MEAVIERLLQPSADVKTEAQTEARPWTKPDDLRARRRELSRLKGSPEMKKKRRAQRTNERDEIAELSWWWLDRMRTTPTPLVEKMALFWHGHFATSVQKVKDAYWMWRQNNLFRRYALGNFRTLLREVARDPAMLIYLDLAQSRASHPNENWARELMELFTLGIGHYSEADVRESARAFTGYRIDLTNQQFRYAPGQHDAARKTFLGHEGNFSGDDILDLIVAQPACAQFLGHKIWRFFVEDEPAPSSVAAVASSLRRNRFELAPVLRELLGAEEFYNARARRSQIKSPVQLLVQTCRLLETSLPPVKVARNALQQMGQIVFAPPNVKGWDGGKSWISTSTLLFRYNFANYLVNGAQGHPRLPVALRPAPVDLDRIIPTPLRAKPEELVVHLTRRFWQASPNEKQLQTFLAYLQTRGPDHGNETMRRLLHLILSTPEYQLT